jgi:hypothetical protein
MKTSYIINSVVILFAIIMLYRAECGKPVVLGETIKIDGKKYEVINQVIDTQYIKVKETKYKKGEDIYHDTTIYLPVPVLDSAQIDSILSQFYAKNTFKDTMKVGKFGQIYIDDTVQYNKLIGRAMSADLQFPSITNTITVKEKPKAQLYLGGRVDYLKEQGLQSPSVGVMVKTKRDMLYGASIGIGNNQRTVYGLNIYVKLF